MASPSNDRNALFAASILALASIAPVGCSSQESTNPLPSSSTSAATGGSGGATTSMSTSSTTSSGGSGGGTTSMSTSSTTSSSSSTSSSGDTWPACHACLQQECATQIAACDSECIAIQACMDTVCGNLSVTGAPDEGDCQVYCQTQHIAQKDAHLDVVNCAQMASACMPPCALASYDWDQCVKDAKANACKPLYAACTSDTDCTDYLACTLTCKTTPACKACFATPEGAAGRAKYEAYWQCVETSCLTEFWLPHL